MGVVTKRLALGTSVTLLSAFCVTASVAQESEAPTPKAVIYPGDVIRDDMLADRPQGGVRDGAGPFVENRALVVGKIARYARYHYLEPGFSHYRETKLVEKLEQMDSFDHRTLQMAHDRIAAYFRFRHADNGQLQLGENLDAY